MKNLINGLKLLFTVRKPALEVVNELKEVKRGYKTAAFWVTLLASLLTLAVAIKGFIPATAGMLTIAGITALYNIARGIKKMQEDGQRGIFTTTEFWISVLGILATAIVDVQKAGFNPEWMASAGTLIGTALLAAREMASAQPSVDANGDGIPD